MCNYCNLEGLEYENIHSHSMYSNIYTPDSIISKEDIAKRAVELGQKTLSLVEHGYFANIFETYDIAKKYGLSLIFGSEFYFVKDRFEKDRTNAHLLVMAKNEKGREEITEMVSESNKTGFYGKPRIDEDLLFKLTPENVIVTTACIASPINKYEDYADYFITACKEHFGDNFFLEVQPHTNIKQIEFNKKLQGYRQEYNVPFILGIDSHYIYADDAKNRDLFLQGKNIYYPEEEGFIIDFPTVEDILKRLSEQAVLSEDEVIEAFESTLIAREFEPVKLDDEIKMPTIYPNLSHEEKVGKLHEIINHAWKEDRKHIPKEKWAEYLKAIQFETNIITDTQMEDYFLLNHKIIDKATTEYGGVLTRTGRGCFTSDALVVTKESLKTIDKVVVGDTVVTDDGKWNKVIDTMEYTIDEDMIEFTYQLQGSTYKKYKNQCTTDHKILIHRNFENIYITASELKIGDLLCSPMIKNDNEVKEDIIVDLNNYNFDNYEYDDNYIYERFASSTGYDYSPRQLDSMGICSHNFAKKIISSEISSLNINRKQGKENVKNIIEKTPFKTLENYKRYGEKHGYTIKPIPRFIKLDSLWNTFLGMMYGDGWTVKIHGIGMAINKTTKSGYNSYVFHKIAERMNVDVIANESSSKNLIQLTISSKILNNWFRTDFFESKKGREKMFNQQLLFNQKTSRIKCLYNGLFRTDGSLNLKENKTSFDNTSLSLINAFKIMSSMLGHEPLSTDVRFSRIDDKGYLNSESYKVRRPTIRVRNVIQRDESYWYLPVENIIEHKNVKTKVYDLSIENNHSYMINNIIVHNSAPSMYINKLFGFTEIDRLEAPITLYPTRFMSKSRILETKSLPDIDYNTADAEPFIKATKDILGEDNAYLMTAYGKMKESEAFRNYCRALNLDISKFNVVGKDLDSYRNDSYWGKIIKESEMFVGVIDSVSPHPCATLLLNEPLSKKLGVIKVGDVFVTLIDSYNSDKYKYLKNDYLTVTVWDIISKVYNEIGMPIDDVRQLLNKVESDDKVWDLYKNGLVSTLNQAGTASGKPQVMQYSPRNVRELSGWVSAIRPSFSSMKHYFLNRKDFSYGISELDELLKSSDNFILYQENIMSVLQFVGFPEDETYGLLKAIAKKKEGIIEPIQERFMKGFIEKTDSEENALKVWKIIEDAVG